MHEAQLLDHLFVHFSSKNQLLYSPKQFLPGQWLDTFVPGTANPGGFTITSQPSKATLSSLPYLELAVQRSPSNPAAAWLWEQPVNDGSHPSLEEPRLQVRVGGSFVWPPCGIDLSSLRRVVFIAGGVGVNPLISILSHLAEGDCPYDVQFLYSTKAPKDLDAEKILFMERLADIYGREKVQGRLRLFLTGLDAAIGSEEPVLSCNEIDVPYKPRRIVLGDVAEALGSKKEHGSTVLYVCGVPSMTDEFVEKLISLDSLCIQPHQVFCEKWW